MQNVNMTEAIVDKTLESVERINGLTFTGGEPLLNVPIIRYITDQIRERGIYLNYFFVVTNGKKFDRDFVDCLIDLYDHCDDTEEMSGLEISQDQFHEEIEIPKMYKALKFFHPDARNNDYRRESIINSGSAKLNRLGSRSPIRSSWSFNDYDEDLICPEMLYVAANGNVFHDCDSSYYRVDKYAAGNVLKESLVDIVARQR